MRKSLRVRSLRQLLGLIALFALASPAFAQASPAEGEEQARAHFRLGRAYYENGDFGRAATEFEAAFRISQRPGLLYNIYLAYRDASDVPHAAEALRKYLELEKNVENRGQLTARLAAMDHALAEEAAQAEAAQQSQAAAGEPAASPQPAATAPSAVNASSEPEAASASQPSAAAGSALSAEPAVSAPSPEARAADRTWPIVLMAGGGVLMASSVVTGVLALGKRSQLSDAQDECSRLGNCSSLPAVRLRQLEDTRKSGTTLATMTDVLLFGGIAVAAAGAAWFIFTPGHEDRASAAAPQASFACIPGNCAARIALRF